MSGTLPAVGGAGEMFYLGSGVDAHDRALREFGTVYTDTAGNVFAWKMYPPVRFGRLRKELAKAVDAVTRLL